MTITNTPKLELLAPAGSLQSFFAAVENGADAIFCGLTHFSARAKAKNFTLPELERIVGYAHSYQKKVYVALNTLLKESELVQVVETLSELARLEIDGLIIQDFGLYHLARTYFPEISLHASTQMVVHNLAGVQMLESLGFERAVLARELSLDEIAYIGKNSTLELEHFIHGALCYSLSGHCLFSSYIDGRSGNRGRCIQPCRRKYHHNQDSAFYFSTSDFSALENIPALAQAGVISLKIEGRMKSAEYVASVVSAYRTVIDAKPGNEKNALALAKQKLESAMGRKSSSGFLHGSSADIVLSKLKGGIGKIIGKVTSIQHKSISFHSSETLHVGDRVRIQPGNDRAGQGFTIRELYSGKRSVKRTGKNTLVTLPLPVTAKVHTGDMIFKLATGKVFSMSEEACKRRLSAAPVKNNDVILKIECDETASLLSITASVKNVIEQKQYQVEMIPAQRTPLNKEILKKVFSHTGHPELRLAELQVGVLPEVVIKPSRLKEIRRDFYTQLNSCVENVLRTEEVQKIQNIKSRIEHSPSAERNERSRKVYIVSDYLADVYSMKNHSELQFVFPLNRLFIQKVADAGLKQNEFSQIVWDIPSILFDDNWAVMDAMVVELLNSGCNRFRVNNIAHFTFFNGKCDVEIIGGSWLYVLNSQSASVMHDLGCISCSLSIEDDKINIRSLLQSVSSDKLIVCIYGPIDLFTSRIQSSINSKEFSLQDDKGELFFIKQNDGLTTTRAEKPFSLLGNLKELREMGDPDVVVDLRGIGFDTSAGKKIMKAFSQDIELSDTTAFNFKRGLE